MTSVTSPSKTSKLSISKNSGSKYTVKWSKVSGAAGYSVYRYDSKKKAYLCIDTVTKTSVSVKAAAKSGTEKLYVKAYSKNGKSFVYGEASPVLKVNINTKK